jgi:hypothetical protein
MKTHILPIICFKDVIKKADEKDYDIFAGTAPCFYDANNNIILEKNIWVGKVITPSGCKYLKINTPISRGICFSN